MSRSLRAMARSRGPRGAGCLARPRIAEEVIKADLGKVLCKLEELQDAQIRAAMAPKETAVTLTDAETVAALELLKDPRLFDRILEDFGRCGVVGEEVNKLMAIWRRCRASWTIRWRW